MKRETIVVIGGGLSGAKAVEAARESGFDGGIVLLTDEFHVPYERPPLSKDYLRGEISTEQLAVRDETFYARHEIELRTGTPVASIDRAGHAVVTASGERLPYTRLLVTTGAEPRQLAVPGAALEGIFSLRTVDDADRLRSALVQASSVVVVGGGWIGSEVAASARQLGRPVTMIHPGPAPLNTVLGPEVAGMYRELHAEHGVRFELGTKVESLRGSTAVEEVVTSSGTTIAADLVVVGVGVTPRAELAAAAGLEIHDGIVVDEQLRTDDQHVFAAGDVAAAYHPHYGSRLRVEHWANAQNQGLVAGRNLAGHRDVYDRLPYFFSDQYDVGMEYVGHAPDWDRVVIRGDLTERKFIAFWIKRNRVVAAMNANIWDVTEPIRRLITARMPVEDALLCDVDTALDDVVAILEAKAAGLAACMHV